MHIIGRVVHLHIIINPRYIDNMLPLPLLLLLLRLHRCIILPARRTANIVMIRAGRSLQPAVVPRATDFYCTAADRG